jgi:hypothetical protein
VFQAVLAAATQDGDMAAAKLLIDRSSRLVVVRRSPSTSGR